MKKLLITTIAMAGITAAASHAATTFAEDFDGNAIGSNFIITDTNSATATVDCGANAFFGLGEGTIGDGSGGNAFGEPSGGPTVYLAFTDLTRDNGQVAIGDINAAVDGGSSPDAPTNAVVGPGSHTLILDYDSATQLLTFSANINGAATATVFLLVF